MTFASFFVGVGVGICIAVMAAISLIRDAKALAHRAEQVLTTGKPPKDARGRFVSLGKHAP